MTVRDPEFDEALRARYPDQHVDVVGRTCDPADLLFAVDEVLYIEFGKTWRGERRRELLGGNDFEKPVFDRNTQRFEHLKRLVGRGRLVPFLGAGVGVACGLPTWREFLLQVAIEHSKDLEREIQASLDAEQFEDAAQHLLETLREPRFAEAFERMFRLKSVGQVSPIIQEIREIASGCIVTTNFDQLIETKLGLTDVSQGRAPIVNFHRALADGDLALLKLHGDLRSSTNRVLTRAEYDEAYGSAHNPDLSLPLPDTLARLFGHHRLLFLGCSLGHDRILNVLRALVENQDQARFPQHYAIAEAPKNLAALNDRESFLNDRMIFPIWYAAGAHHVVPALLRELARGDL